MTDTTTEQVAADAAPEVEVTAPAEQQSPETAEAPEQELEESAPSEESGQDQAEEQQPKKKGGGFQKKIDQLTREKYEERIRNQQLEARLQELEKKLAPAEVQAPSEPPTLEQFSDIEDYYKAVKDWNKQTADYARQEAIKEARQQTEAQKQEQEAIRLKATIDAREATVKAKYQDYEPVINAVAPILMDSPTFHQFVTESEAAPEVAYHLAKNPAVMASVLAMPPVQQGVELYKLAERLTAPPPPKPLTQATPPLKTVGSNNVPKLSLEDLDMKEFVRRRNEEERKRKG